MIGPFTQGHLLPMVTPAAILRCIGRINFDELSASFFRFAGQFPEKFRPGGICNALCQTMIVNQTVHMQVFYANRTETVDDLSTLLMGEIVTPERNPLMYPGYYLAMFPSLSCAFGKLTMFAVDFRQCLFFLAKKAGIGYLFSIAERGKGLQANVYAHLGRHFGQAFRFALTGERDVPLPCRATADSTGSDVALDGTVIDHLDRTNLGKCHAIIMRDAEARLWEGETIVSALALKPRKPRRVRSFSDAPEKGFESQINAHGDVLQDLRMDLFQGKTFLFQHRKCVNVSVARQACTSLLIGLFAMGEQVVIQPTALFQGLVELVKLFLGWVDPILKHFMHTYIVAHNGQEVKRGTTPRLPQERSAPSIPTAKAEGFTARFDKSRRKIVY